MPQARVRIGTSGWSYPTGRGRWSGVFYPAGPRSARRGAFDALAYYAERFDCVEVNSSFYRVPDVGTTHRWATRTPPGFEFAVKLHRQFTHPAMHARATGDVTGSVGQLEVDGFRAALEPLAAADRLGPLLIQFPASFQQSNEADDYLGWLMHAFRDYALAVELRHASWSDAADALRERLRPHGAAWVFVDEPKFATSIVQRLGADASPLQYVRLHGRNGAQWWRPDAPEDRYNYLYSAQELDPLAAHLEEARRLAKRIYVFMNNHFEAKAVANAVMLRSRLGIDTPGDFTQAFVERYPDVDGLVTAARQGLF